MPSTVSTTTAPEEISEEVAAIKTPPLTPRAMEESNESNDSIHDSEAPVKGEHFQFLNLKPLSYHVVGLLRFTCLLS
jgi:hypothetical protein